MTPTPPPDDPLRELLSGLRPPGPPPPLRTRVLARASAALQPGPAADPWWRVWESRPLRLAWACTVVLLAGANLLLPPRRGREAAVAGSTSAMPVTAAPAVDPELAAAERLPRLRSELAAAGAGPAVPSPSAAPAPVPPAIEKGTSS